MNYVTRLHNDIRGVVGGEKKSTGKTDEFGEFDFSLYFIDYSTQSELQQQEEQHDSGLHALIKSTSMIFVHILTVNQKLKKTSLMVNELNLILLTQHIRCVYKKMQIGSDRKLESLT